MWRILQIVSVVLFIVIVALVMLAGTTGSYLSDWIEYGKKAASSKWRLLVRDVKAELFDAWQQRHSSVYWAWCTEPLAQHILEALACIAVLWAVWRLI